MPKDKAMTVEELIKILKKAKPNQEVIILDTEAIIEEEIFTVETDGDAMLR
ncbi:MAG: hypothetical protein WCG95_06930 [bacterium]